MWLSPSIRPGIRLARTVVTTPVDDGLTLLENRRGTLYHLNRSGCVILTALVQDGGTIESAVAALVDQYRISEDQARADVTVLVENMRARGLITSR